VRNYEGNFHFGFYVSVGSWNVLHAEIQALLIDIKLCWQTDFKKVICYSDSFHVVQLVTMGTH
jgi:ribonuclease HI